MENLDPCLTFEIVWRDVDYFQAEIVACNSKFQGTTKIYMGNGQLKQFADGLASFPINSDDKRHFEFGNEFALLALDFFYEAKGLYSAVKINIADQVWEQSDLDRQSRASFELRIEPAAIDRFVPELVWIDSERAGIAVLASI